MVTDYDKRHNVLISYPADWGHGKPLDYRVMLYGQEIERGQIPLSSFTKEFQAQLAPTLSNHHKPSKGS